MYSYYNGHMLVLTSCRVLHRAWTFLEGSLWTVTSWCKLGSMNLPTRTIESFCCLTFGLTSQTPLLCLREYFQVVLALFKLDSLETSCPSWRQKARHAYRHLRFWFSSISNKLSRLTFTILSFPSIFGKGHDKERICMRSQVSCGCFLYNHKDIDVMQKLFTRASFLIFWIIVISFGSSYLIAQCCNHTNALAQWKITAMQ